MSHGNTKHGQADSRSGRRKTRLYRAWSDMHTRCYNEHHIRWARYGGRGIKVHPRWHTFEPFAADMGDCPPGYSLERIDGDGDYEPGNCRWASSQDQANNRVSNRLICFGAEVHTAAEWSRITGIKSATIRYRLDHGWNEREALGREAH